MPPRSPARCDKGRRDERTEAYCHVTREVCHATEVSRVQEYRVLGRTCHIVSVGVCGVVEVASLMISWIANTAINTTFTMTSPLADVVHSLYGKLFTSNEFVVDIPSGQSYRFLSCPFVANLPNACEVVTSFTCALVSSVTVSTAHVLFPVHVCHVLLCHHCICVHFRRALESQSKTVFHISHHIGLHRISTLHTRPHWKRSRLLLIIVVPRGTACSCPTAEKRACFMQAAVKRKEIYLRPSDPLSIDSWWRHGISCFFGVILA